MDTSDDPVSMAVVGAGIMGGMGLFGGGKDDDVSMPSIEAAQAKATAQPVKKVSETEKRNKRRVASMMTQGWGELNLGTEGLLGL